MNYKTKKQQSRFEDTEGSREVLHTINVQSVTIIKVLLVMIGAYFLWTIRNVLGVLFVALVLASALDPWVDRLERYRIPRGVSILTMFFVFLAICVFAFYLIIPPLVTQLTEILSALRQYSPELESLYQSIQPGAEGVAAEINQSLANFNSSLSNLTTGVYSALTELFGSIATFIFVLVITFYMTVEEEGLKKFIRSVAPIKYQPYLVQKTNRIQHRMGGWLRGQLILMFIIGLCSFIGLFILQVPYALVLALVAGLAEFVPFLGPIIAAVPAVFFAYTDSPWKAVAVIIFYTVLQQVENQVLVPQVMKKAVGLNPIVVITVMLIGAQVAGLVGILLAVPATTIAWIFIEDIFKHKKEMDNKLEEPA